MDIRRLEIFLAVVDEGGFTSAADELDISQPGVSQSVRELERELGTALFTRVGRGVVLTAAGRALVEPARQLRRDLAVGEAAVRGVIGLGKGELDVACLPTLAAAPLAPLVGAFRSRYPGVLVRLAAPEDSAGLLDLVRSGRAELGIVDDALATGTLRAVRLGEQDFLLVAPPGSGHRGEVAIAALAETPFVAPPLGTSSRALLDEAFTRAGMRVQIAVEAGQREALLPLVLAGAGSALLPRPLAELAGRLGCRIATPLPTPRRRVLVVMREGPLSPAAEAFLALADAAPEGGAASPQRRAQRRASI